MEAMPPCSFSGEAMLASLADLTLPHPESDIPGQYPRVEDTASPSQLQYEPAYGFPRSTPGIE